MNENQIGTEIITSAIKVHKLLGPGLLESVYEKVLAFELNKKSLCVERQVSIPVDYENLIHEIGFRADIIVENKVIVELKSVSEICDLHKKQLLAYLKLGNFKLGYLLNFNVLLMRDGITRIVNGLK